MVCGSLVNLQNFVQPLRSRVLASPRPIVFLSRKPPPSEEWERISHFSQVLYRSGSSSSVGDIRRTIGDREGDGSSTLALLVILTTREVVYGVRYSRASCH